MRRRTAFTLTEMLIVVGLLAVLLAVALPSLGGLRQTARVTQDLANVRNLQLAHHQYMTDHDFHFVDMNLAHATGSSDPSVVPWIQSLQEHYDTPLAVRSPLDRSPHWPLDQGGQGVPLAVVQLDGYQFRRTSYGCNAFLSWSLAPSPDFAITGQSIYVYDRLTRVKHPASTVDFLLMAEAGPYAGSDHVHPEQWSDAGHDQVPSLAAQQVHIAAAGGRTDDWAARSNYGFLDGHAETLMLAEVYVDPEHNFFDPAKVNALHVLQRRN